MGFTVTVHEEDMQSEDSSDVLPIIERVITSGCAFEVKNKELDNAVCV